MFFIGRHMGFGIKQKGIVSKISVIMLYYKF